MNITEFLEARIGEDEADATADSAEMSQSDVSIQFDCATQARFDPARVLAECAAKRAILAECREDYEDSLTRNDDTVELAIVVLYALAAVYKDHPDYQQEWG